MLLNMTTYRLELHLQYNKMLVHFLPCLFPLLLFPSHFFFLNSNLLTFYAHRYKFIVYVIQSLYRVSDHVYGSYYNIFLSFTFFCPAKWDVYRFWQMNLIFLNGKSHYYYTKDRPKHSSYLHWNWLQTFDFTVFIEQHVNRRHLSVLPALWIYIIFRHVFSFHLFDIFFSVCLTSMLLILLWLLSSISWLFYSCFFLYKNSVEFTNLILKIL